MHRLIAFLFCPFVRVRIYSIERRIADLEWVLSELVTERDSINAEIDETTRRLLIAQDVKKSLYIPQPTPERRTRP